MQPAKARVALRVELKDVGAHLAQQPREVALARAVERIDDHLQVRTPDRLGVHRAAKRIQVRPHEVDQLELAAGGGRTVDQLGFDALRERDGGRAAV